MAVPKRKTSPSKRNMRRAHDSLGTAAYQESKETGALKLRHHVSADGWYRGRQVVKTKKEAAEAETAE